MVGSHDGDIMIEAWTGVASRFPPNQGSSLGLDKTISYLELARDCFNEAVVTSDPGDLLMLIRSGQALLDAAEQACADATEKLGAASSAH
jgi:hypothetical protein